MGIFDYIIIGALAVWFVFSVIWVRKRKKKGGCCGDCSSCAMCNKRNKEK